MEVQHTTWLQHSVSSDRMDPFNFPGWVRSEVRNTAPHLKMNTCPYFFLKRIRTDLLLNPEEAPNVGFRSKKEHPDVLERWRKHLISPNWIQNRGKPQHAGPQKKRSRSSLYPLLSKIWWFPLNYWRRWTFGASSGLSKRWSVRIRLSWKNKASVG